MGKFIDRTGIKYGTLVADEYVGSGKWKCHCEKCGNVFIKTSTQMQKSGCNYCWKKHINSNFFQQIDNEIKAYYFGLFWADGYCSERLNIFKIDLQESDKEILEKFNKFVESSHEINQYIAKLGNSYRSKESVVYRFITLDKTFVQSLFQKGLSTHREGSHLPFEYVPENLLVHFIRGYFDGNGSISIIKGRVVNMCGGDVILHDIDNILKNMNFKTAFHRRRPDVLNNNTLYVQGGAKEQKRFLDWIYGDATIYLNRKYEKYLQF